MSARHLVIRTSIWSSRRGVGPVVLGFAGLAVAAWIFAGPAPDAGSRQAEYPDCPGTIGGFTHRSSDVGVSETSLQCFYGPGPKPDDVDADSWRPGDVRLAVAWRLDTPEQRSPCWSRDPEPIDDMAGGPEDFNRSIRGGQRNASVTYYVTEGSEVTRADAETAALALLGSAESLGHPCVPEAEPPADSAFACPLVIGDTYVRADWYGEDEPAIADLSSSEPPQTRRQLICRYRAAYQAEGGSATVRVDWIEGPPSDSGVFTTGCRNERIDAGSDTRISSGAHPVRVTVDNELLAAGGEALADRLLADASARTQRCPTADAATSDGEACAVRGRVLDRHGAGVAGIEIGLAFGGSMRQTTATAPDGTYRFLPTGSATRGFDFDPALDPVEVWLITRENTTDPGRFEVRYGDAGELARLRAGPMLLEDLPGCRLDIDIRDLGDVFESVSGPSGFDHWDDVIEIYQNTRTAWEFAETSLGVVFDDQLPLEVFAFCSPATPGTLGRCTPPETGFWNGSSSHDPDGSNPFVAFGAATSDLAVIRDAPHNREYHEIGHAVMADTFGDQLPNNPDLRNHGGLYANPTSTDAWVEGWAEFFATQVAKHADGNAPWWLYPVRGAVVSLEDDRVVWDRDGEDEEYALAGILVDLVDGPADYAGGIERELTVSRHEIMSDPQAGTVLVVAIANPFSEPAGPIRVEVEIVGRSEQRSVVSGFAEEAMLAPGGTTTVYVPVAATQVSLVRSVRATTATTVDDDPVTIPLRDLWEAIITYRGTHPSGNGFLHNVSELYEALVGAFPGRVAGIEEIFVAHGYFEDTDGGTSNRIRDLAEEAGPSSYVGIPGRPDRSPRLATPSIDVFDTVVDTGGVSAELLVQVRYPAPFEGRGYAYRTRVDPESGTAPVAVPPASSGATVGVVVLADGYRPVVGAELDAAGYWAEAEANGFAPFLTIAAPMVPDGSGAGPAGLPIGWLSAGVGLVAAAGVIWTARRRRQDRTGAVDAPPPPPPPPALV